MVRSGRPGVASGWSGREGHGLTTIFGLACDDAGDQDCGQLLTRADRALYQAKQSDRDRIAG